MSKVTEHNPEEEGEGGTGKDCWINFFVRRSAVGIDHLLERGSELV